MNRSTIRFRAAVVGAAAFAVVLAGCSGGGGDEPDADGPVELTLLTGTVEANVQAAQGVADAFNASQDDVVVTLDSSVPSGSEGDNLLKTQLATGEMTDMFWYNSGSLFQALSPDETLLNVGDEEWVEHAQRRVRADRFDRQRHVRRADREHDRRRGLLLDPGLRGARPRGSRRRGTSSSPTPRH